MLKQIAILKRGVLVANIPWNTQAAGTAILHFAAGIPQDIKRAITRFAADNNQTAEGEWRWKWK